MTDIKCRVEVGVFVTFHGSGLDIQKAPGEIPYAGETKSQCLLVSVIV